MYHPNIPPSPRPAPASQPDMETLPACSYCEGTRLPYLKPSKFLSCFFEFFKISALFFFNQSPSPCKLHLNCASWKPPSLQTPRVTHRKSCIRFCMLLMPWCSHQLGLPTGQGGDNFLSPHMTPAHSCQPGISCLEPHHNNSSAWHFTTFSLEVYLDSLMTVSYVSMFLFLFIRSHVWHHCLGAKFMCACMLNGLYKQVRQGAPLASSCGSAISCHS